MRRNAYKIFVRNPEGKKRSLVDKEIEYDRVDWI
jgi:hypothetical protein